LINLCLICNLQLHRPKAIAGDRATALHCCRTAVGTMPSVLTPVVTEGDAKDAGYGVDDGSKTQVFPRECPVAEVDITRWPPQSLDTATADVSDDAATSA